MLHCSAIGDRRIDLHDLSDPANIVWSRALDSRLHSLASYSPTQLLFLDGSKEFGLLDCTTNPPTVRLSGQRCAQSVGLSSEMTLIPGTSFFIPHSVLSATADHNGNLYTLNNDKLSVDQLSNKGLRVRTLVRVETVTWRLDAIAWSGAHGALIVACHDEQWQVSGHSQISVLKTEFL